MSSSASCASRNTAREQARQLRRQRLRAKLTRKQRKEELERIQGERVIQRQMDRLSIQDSVGPVRESVESKQSIQPVVERGRKRTRQFSATRPFRRSRAPSPESRRPSYNEQRSRCEESVEAKNDLSKDEDRKGTRSSEPGYDD